mmetsp:Transcript_32652/g.29528  ORF Transcript_32652/g.29528 Transcript_32652/m.29528 type:complete len:91 (-) Transcript_32652:233-505(-)
MDKPGNSSPLDHFDLSIDLQENQLSLELFDNNNSISYVADIAKDSVESMTNEVFYSIEELADGLKAALKGEKGVNIKMQGNTTLLYTSQV